MAIYTLAHHVHNLHKSRSTEFFVPSLSLSPSLLQTASSLLFSASENVQLYSCTVAIVISSQ